jgi:hypothetical protein
MIAEADQLAEIVERATDCDAEQDGRHFRTNLRAFHMAVKVIAARSTLSGFIEAHSAGTFMNGTVWSKPQTLPSCTRKRSSAAAF